MRKKVNCLAIDNFFSCFHIPRFLNLTEQSYIYVAHKIETVYIFNRKGIDKKKKPYIFYVSIVS